MAKTLQEKLDAAAKAVEPVLWKILEEQDCDYCEAGIAENHNHESEGE